MIDYDDAFDENGVLKPGVRGIRVPMLAMDAMQRSVREHFTRITDASGSTAGLHRPGYRVSDSHDFTPVERQRLSDEYDRDLTNAWRRTAEDADWGEEGDQCTVREGGADEGAPGHLHSINGRLVCVPDPGYRTSRTTGRTDRASVMDKLYQEYDDDLENARRYP